MTTPGQFWTEVQYSLYICVYWLLSVCYHDHHLLLIQRLLEVDNRKYLASSHAKYLPFLLNGEARGGKEGKDPGLCLSFSLFRSSEADLQDKDDDDATEKDSAHWEFGWPTLTPTNLEDKTEEKVY